MSIFEIPDKIIKTDKWPWGEADLGFLRFPFPLEIQGVEMGEAAAKTNLVAFSPINSVIMGGEGIAMATINPSNLEVISLTPLNTNPIAESPSMPSVNITTTIV